MKSLSIEQPLAEFRTRATKAAFPGVGPVDISQAYKELTRPAFAFWIRLHVASPEELASRQTLANSLKATKKSVRNWATELERKKYLTFARNRPTPDAFVLLRRAIIRNHQEFQRY